MSTKTAAELYQTNYAQSNCDIGIVHLGFGAFHRAHQAVYIDDYMQKSGDLNWGIAAVNLRAAEAQGFAASAQAHDGYILKTVEPNGTTAHRRVRSHVHFADWHKDAQMVEGLLAKPSVKLVTITVTESGYYLDKDGQLDLTLPAISDEMAGEEKSTIYAYLAAALARRAIEIDEPITIACCDNLRGNGEMLRRNFLDYLVAAQQTVLADWVQTNATFPNSMVDRITPRRSPEAQESVQAIFGANIGEVIQSEAFSQWVIEDNFANKMPAFAAVGVEVVDDVDPYEEAKIRILNGGHTCLTYFAALKGHATFDQAMADPELTAHFEGFERLEVLPALPQHMPLDTKAYLKNVTLRFCNKAIADSVERICADGFAKFPIFIRPTIEARLESGNMPTYAIRSIASWYCFTRAFKDGRATIDYLEPNWASLLPLIKPGNVQGFSTSTALWSDLPKRFPEFAKVLSETITEMEKPWPV